MFLKDKTVYCGESLRDFNYVRTTLENAKIPYKYKVIDTGHNKFLGPGRGVTRSLGMNFSIPPLLYDVKVKMKYYEEAMYLILKKD